MESETETITVEVIYGSFHLVSISYDYKRTGSSTKNYEHLGMARFNFSFFFVLSSIAVVI